MAAMVWRSGKDGVGDSNDVDDACSWQHITQSAQSCWPWSGDGVCWPSAGLGAWQIGISPSGAAAMASGARGIMATTSTWHQAASHIRVKRMTVLIARQQ
jgi:hypothetical protein